MVYSSIPVYVDPPNWHQQPNLHQANGSDNNSTQLLPPLPAQAGPPLGGAGMGSIRPGSMADRARLAKIPPPEVALKCPRCESTNTKFCYFNNYSLSQPRHFCKTCRRYWTRGGALRNVPVGGGCRRNKKNKRSRSKSPASNTTEKQQQPLTNSLSPTSAIIIPNSSGNTHELINHQLPHQPPNLPFMASLQNLSRYGAVGNIGLSLREIQGQGQQTNHHHHHQHHMGFQTGGGGGNSSDSAAASGGADHHHHQWRLQQFPFLSGFESSSNSAAAASYPFQNEGINNETTPSGLVGDISVGSRVTTNTHQMQPPVKMEENGVMNNLSRSHLNNHINNNVSDNNQYYSWTTDMSGLASSSTSHLL